MKTILSLLFAILFLSGCASPQPERPVHLKFPPVEYVK